MIKRLPMVIEIILIEVGAILRLAYIAKTPPWYDEAYTMLITRRPLDQLLRAAAGDVHPPLYYLLTAPLAALPQPLTLRLVSAACSIAALLVLLAIIRAYELPRPVQIGALAMAALSPVQWYYAQEARMYSLFQLLVLLAWWAALRRRWGWFGLLNLAILYTHTYGLFYVAALGLLSVLLELQRPRPVWVAGDPPFADTAMGEILAAVVLPYLAWAPWAWVILTQQIPGISGAGGYWMDYQTPGIWALNTANVVFAAQGSSLTDPAGVVVAALAVPVALLYGLRRNPGAAAVLILPALCAIAISLLWRPIYLYRALLPSMPALYLLLAGWLHETTPARRRWALAFVLPALIGAWVVWLSTTATGIRAMSWDYRPAVALPAGAEVVHLDDSSWVIWQAVRPDLRNRLLASQCPDEPGSLTPATRAALGMQPVETLPPGAYVVYAANYLTTPCQLERAARIRAGLQLVYRADLMFGELEVAR